MTTKRVDTETDLHKVGLAARRGDSRAVCRWRGALLSNAWVTPRPPGAFEPAHSTPLTPPLRPREANLGFLHRWAYPPLRLHTPFRAQAHLCDDIDGSKMHRGVSGVSRKAAPSPQRATQVALLSTPPNQPYTAGCSKAKRDRFGTALSRREPLVRGARGPGRRSEACACRGTRRALSRHGPPCAALTRLHHRACRSRTLSAQRPRASHLDARLFPNSPQRLASDRRQRCNSRRARVRQTIRGRTTQSNSHVESCLPPSPPNRHDAPPTLLGI